MRKLEEYGSIILAIFGALAFLVFIAFLIAGTLWISVKVLPILETAFQFTLAISIVILLPLALFHKTRGWSGVGLFLASHVFGLNLWVWSFLLVYQFWGNIGIVIGLILAGIGVIPIAFLAILFGHLSYMPDMIGLLVCTFGARLLGAYLVTNYDEKQEAIYSDQLLASMVQNDSQPIPPENTLDDRKTKQRHWCLTTWLVLSTIVYSILLLYVVSKTFPLFQYNYITNSYWLTQMFVYSFVDIILVTFIIVCTIAMFQWKKWGFYGYVIASIVSAIIGSITGFANHANIAYAGHTVFWLCGIAILYGVLKIGGEHRGWDQLT